ncbi:MAG: MarR family winged helix-turn-helix transcriptional regulator [Erysipelotrichaceae bacterium]
MEDRYSKFTMLINNINRSIKKIENDQMHQYNLRSYHISCLYYLYKYPAVTATDLVELSQLDKASISRSIDFLQENDYIYCQSKTAKKYKSPILLTEKGEIIAAEIAGKIDAVIKEMDSLLTDEQRVHFYQTLESIYQTLKEVQERKEIKNEH